jgi:hypothetical protein
VSRRKTKQSKEILKKGPEWEGGRSDHKLNYSRNGEGDKEA